MQAEAIESIVYRHKVDRLGRCTVLGDTKEASEATAAREGQAGLLMGFAERARAWLYLTEAGTRDLERRTVCLRETSLAIGRR
jgi:hypothetical protein